MIPPPTPSKPAINPAKAAAIAKTANKLIMSVKFKFSIMS